MLGSEGPSRIGTSGKPQVNLLGEVERFLRHKEAAPTTFGRKLLEIGDLSLICATAATPGHRPLRGCSNIWRRLPNEPACNLASRGGASQSPRRAFRSY